MCDGLDVVGAGVGDGAGGVVGAIECVGAGVGLGLLGAFAVLVDVLGAGLPAAGGLADFDERPAGRVLLAFGEGEADADGRLLGVGPAAVCGDGCDPWV